FVHETPRSNAVYQYHHFQFGRTFNFLHTYAIHLNLSHGFTYLSLLLMSALPTRATTNRQKQNLAAINTISPFCYKEDGLGALTTLWLWMSLLITTSPHLLRFTRS
ncbi:hypothetical protein BY996DRAFT_7350064, partial [Phakopsora pachyrhizi]